MSMYKRKPVVNVHGNYRKDAGSPRRDKKVFSKTAGMTHRLNISTSPMRGGERL